MPPSSRPAVENAQASAPFRDTAGAAGVGHRAHPESELAGAFSLPLSSRRVTRTLYAIVAAFTVIQAAILIWRFGLGGQGLVRTTDFFMLDGENNLPTFFSSAMLLAGGLLCAFTGAFRPSPLRRYWYLLAGVFLFLAVDESAQVHEYVGDMIERVWTRRGALQWPWVIPYTAAGAAFAMVCAPFLRTLPGTIARRFVVAGVVYVTGAVGMDVIEGAVSSAMRAGARHLEPLFRTLPAVEEPLEMIGVILFIAAVLRYLEQTTDVIHVRVTR